MKKFLAIAIAFAVASSAGANTSVKLGYSSLPVKVLYNIQNITTGVMTNGSEALSAGVLNISGESMTKVNDMLSIGLEVTAGAPMGEAKQDLTKQLTDLPAGSTEDPFEGDSSTFKVATLGAMAKAKLGMAAGPGTVGLGIGAGTVIVSLLGTDVDTVWSGFGGTYKTAASDTVVSKTTTYSVNIAPVFVLSIAPSFDMTLSDTDSVGVEIPLNLLSTTRVGNDNDSTVPATVGDDNPLKDGAEIGGFSWGINVAYTRKF